MPRSSRAKKAPPRAAGEDAGPRPQWSGTISFGLVSIPVDLYPATRSGGVHLRMLGPSGHPLSRRFYCSKEQKPVDSSELVRGFEVREGEYVEVTDEELEALEPQKSRDIDLRLFVAQGAIDPMYFERSYVLAPAGDSGKAYHLLAAVMERSGRVGVATFVMREHGYVVALHADQGLLRATVLRFGEELRAPLHEEGKAPSSDESAVARITKLVHGSKKHTAVPAESLRDRDAEALLALAHEKAKRSDAIVRSDQPEEPAEEEDEQVDLLQILRRSLGPANTARPKAQRRAKAPAQARPRSRGRATRAHR